ncbi:NAD(P)/FAD-dependent oxidoreductase [Actinoallomurus sp. CA-150999]|uniref:NAD(P)/FAD-dependent oxidoreductase n=1 Tax=Actinoallomurus sp. CA-150999 TaxID=3239887 RepID=UPI003D8B9FE9
MPICNIDCKPAGLTIKITGMSSTEDPRGAQYDVAVIGGGAAGLSAGITLTRALRSVVVFDAGHPRNRPAKAVHGFLSRDGAPPGELLAVGRRELVRYGGLVLSRKAVSARRSDTAFEVTAEDGDVIRARRLMVTSGLTDELPEVPGVRERWGKDVVHCPYCHGWEIRGRAIGVLAGGPMAIHQALLFRQWTDDLMLLTHTTTMPTPDQLEQLVARGIQVVPGVVERLEITDDRLRGARLTDGNLIAREAIVVAPRMVAASPVLESLGLKPIAHPLGSAVGAAYEADPTGATPVEGVWVAGNVHDIQAQLITSAAQGAAAAAALNAHLIAEETKAAVVRSRAEVSP